MSSDVVGVRNEIEALIGQGEVTIPDETLENWADRLRRAPAISHRQSSPPMTAEIAEQVRELHQQGLNHAQIAAELGINSGRVSEVLTGYRFAD